MQIIRQTLTINNVDRSDCDVPLELPLCKRIITQCPLTKEALLLLTVHNKTFPVICVVTQCSGLNKGRNDFKENFDNAIVTEVFMSYK